MAGVTARRQTRLLRADKAGIAQAAALLRAGGLVAFPTETVYGLGAHALDAEAVRGIFEAKRRPADDPLIVHFADAAAITAVAVTNPHAEALARRFWPGPLTLVLPRRPGVPAEVTAGLDTVAVRVPQHPVARELLQATGLPLAAPSANLFGHPSPTRAEHVLNDLDGRIDAILDGGPTPVGVESTIVDFSSGVPRLLRPGGLAAEEIEAVLGEQLLPPPSSTPPGSHAAPGLMPSHYAPVTPLVLIAGPPVAARRRLVEAVNRALEASQRVGVLALEDDRDLFPEGALVEVVGSWADPQTTARRLFEAMRALDAKELDLLFVRELSDPAQGLGRALADRLSRAARRVIDVRD